MGRLISILALVLAGAVSLPSGAQAAFGLSDFDVAFSNSDGSLAIQAGSHPFAYTTSLTSNVSGDEVQGRLRELFIDEMPGLVTAPIAVPRCSDGDFETLNEGVNDCPNATAVGIVETASDESDDRTMTPVFNLVPPFGAFMRLGFRLASTANVVVDFELSPERPYRLLASVGEIPEAVELFAAGLHLWGVPASPSHDQLRGRCAEDGGIGSCPVAIPEVPLLTLPTSCDGPQETFYDALSWEDDEDFGSASSPGFSGCGHLGFGSFATAKFTTKAADSPTGLAVSVAFIDEGLANPGGIAQSQVRDLVLALPQGMTAGPSLTASSGGCTETEVEAETPGSAPGDGCPASSEVGTAEVESPLVEGQLIQGTVYRATPNENFADSPMALYVVLKNADLGIVIAQPVALETDPDTGQLIAVAEEMPQIPFSDLTLHLDDGKGGPLVSPPLCGEYETEAEFDPWSGGGSFRLLFPFQISSGPNDGPCPTGSNESHSESGPPSGGSPPSARAPAVPPKLVAHKHRCRNGRHKVWRHGKSRCVAKRHRKHKPHAR